jgi:LacI family transcriptional regulator
VFCANNRNTIGALEEIGRRLRAGVDAAGFPAIVSFDDFELSGLMPVPVTVLDHDARQLGRETAQLLFERLAADATDIAPRTIELPVRLLPPP